MMVTVRAETGRDVAAVRSVHRAASPSALESKLVDTRRAAGKAGVDEPFVALALKANGLRAVAGLVRYHPEFTLGRGQRAAAASGCAHGCTASGRPAGWRTGDPYRG
jgi:predicted N-acetyltransferase YhbS